MFGLKDSGENTKKSLRQAYILWALLGAFGAHRFYLGRGTSGATLLVMTVIGLIFLASGAGSAFLTLVVIWIGADALLIPRMVCTANRTCAPLTASEEMRQENRAWH